MLVIRKDLPRRHGNNASLRCIRHFDFLFKYYDGKSDPLYPYNRNDPSNLLLYCIITHILKKKGAHLMKLNFRKKRNRTHSRLIEDPYFKGIAFEIEDEPLQGSAICKSLPIPFDTYDPEVEIEEYNSENDALYMNSLAYFYKNQETILSAYVHVFWDEYDDEMSFQEAKDHIKIHQLLIRRLGDYEENLIEYSSDDLFIVMLGAYEKEESWGLNSDIYAFMNCRTKELFYAKDSW